jgi:[ribosomal protein S5]-alanine N-acetyltransferase
MATMRTLHAPGLTLEPQTAAHAPAMFPVLADPAVYTYIDDAPPASVDTLRDDFERLESRASADGSEQWLNWAIRTDAGALAGFVQATVQAGGVAWIAFVLGQAYWGRGIAQAATRAMLAELDAAYGVTRFQASVDRANQRSLRLLARLGFVRASETLRAQRGVAESDVLMTLLIDGRR